MSFTRWARSFPWHRVGLTDEPCSVWGGDGTGTETPGGGHRWPATPARYSVFSGEASNLAFPLETVIFLVAASSGAF